MVVSCESESPSRVFPLGSFSICSISSPLPVRSLRLSRHFLLVLLRNALVPEHPPYDIRIVILYLLYIQLWKSYTPGGMLTCSLNGQALWPDGGATVASPSSI
jgi:hypothetical protein